MNGRVIPVSGMSLRLPAAMMNAWTPTTSASPAARSARKSSRGRGRDPQASLDDDEVEPEDRHDPDSPSSSPRAANGKSVWIAGIGSRPSTVGSPPPRPGPEQPAPGERVERLDDLVAGAGRIGERVEPDVDPGPDVVERAGT